MKGAWIRAEDEEWSMTLARRRPVIDRAAEWISLAIESIG